MKQIPLTQVKFALVDDEDFEFLNQWKWCAQKSNNTFYAIRKASRTLAENPRKNIIMHRFILSVADGVLVDHIDRNGLNNTRANLRLCTQTENLRNNNLYKNNATGFKGVSVRGNIFRAKIYIQKKQISLGNFATSEEAARAYDQAALKYFGEFASLNFPQGDSK